MKICSGYWPEPAVPCQRILRDGVCPKQGDSGHGYRKGGPPEDPRWDWVNVSTMSRPDQWIRGECRHLAPDPVLVKDPVDVTGETLILVAWYCPDCDGQFEPDRFSPDTDPFGDDDPPAWSRWDSAPEPNGFERWAYAPRTVDHPAGLEETVRLALGKDPHAHLVFVAGGVVSKSDPPSLPSRIWKGYVSVWEWIKDHSWVIWLWVSSVLVLAAVTGHLEGWK